MQRPLIIIRPEPGCTATLRAAQHQGLAALAFPLFTIRPLPWAPPDPAVVDALLIGSANAPRYAGPALADFADKPAYAVGASTAAACRAAGLTLARVGRGGLQPLLDDLAGEPRRLLRLSGQQRVALTAPDGITLWERIIYTSEALPMPDALARWLCGATGAIVLLHSAEAARHFAAECDRLAIPRAGGWLVALAPRIAEAAGSGWAMCTSATQPQDNAVLALARQMCEWPQN